MFESIQQCIYQGFSSEQIVPFFVLKICSNNSGTVAIALSHQLKEGVNLFGFKGKVSQFINDQNGIVAQPFNKLWCGSVGQ